MDHISEQESSLAERLQYVEAHFVRNACSQVVRQLKGILDGEAMLRPGLALPRQAFGVPDADHILLPVEHLGVVAQKAEPELPNRLPVSPVIGPHARQALGVLAVEQRWVIE